jgi:hypothetical protein
VITFNLCASKIRHGSVSVAIEAEIEQLQKLVLEPDIPDASAIKFHHGASFAKPVPSLGRNRRFIIKSRFIAARRAAAVASARTSISVWQATTAATSYPQLTRHLAMDVAIVGGGITGLTTALLFKRAGRSVAVLEALQIGESVTSYTVGYVAELLSLGYRDLIASFGEESARLEVQARRAAIDCIAKFVQEE